MYDIGEILCKKGMTVNMYLVVDRDYVVAFEYFCSRSVKIDKDQQVNKRYPAYTKRTRASDEQETSASGQFLL
jgi:hypothetical protein